MYLTASWIMKRSRSFWFYNNSGSSYETPISAQADSTSRNVFGTKLSAITSDRERKIQPLPNCPIEFYILPQVINL